MLSKLSLSIVNHTQVAHNQAIQVVPKANQVVQHHLKTAYKRAVVSQTDPKPDREGVASIRRITGSRCSQLWQAERRGFKTV